LKYPPPQFLQDFVDGRLFLSLSFTWPAMQKSLRLTDVPPSLQFSMLRPPFALYYQWRPQKRTPFSLSVLFLSQPLHTASSCFSSKFAPGKRFFRGSQRATTLLSVLSRSVSFPSTQSRCFFSNHLIPEGHDGPRGLLILPIGLTTPTLECHSLDG